MRTRRRRILTVLGWLVLVGTVAVVVLIGYGGWRLNYGIPLRVDVRADRIIVDTQRLGEYYSALSRIRVSDPVDSRTLWEATSTAENGLSHVWTFTLVSGENQPPKRLSETFRTTVPVGGGEFMLEAGRRYRVDVWGPSERHHNARTIVVPVPKKGSAETP